MRLGVWRYIERVVCRMKKEPIMCERQSNEYELKIYRAVNLIEEDSMVIEGMFKNHDIYHEMMFYSMVKMEQAKERADRYNPLAQSHLSENARKGRV